MAENARWRELQDLFEHVPLEDPIKDRLLAEMSRPGRIYHGVKHLEILWRRHGLYSVEAGLAGPAPTRLLACAIAYHDSVYDVRRDDNEDRSAEVWLRDSAAAHLSEEDREWVARTISATSDHLSYHADLRASGPKARLREKARLWMLDLDLTPLGETPETFDENSLQLRAEFAHLSSAKWRASMMEFRRRFLEAPQIYRSPVLAAHFEVAARSNLARPIPN
jgi:predicted metal-dependent HD superfamily phosphohydrolase